MDILERLVKQILDDITEAQDQANKRSAKLSVQYQNGEIKNLEHYAVPNAVVKSFDFTLKFALESLGDVLSQNIVNDLNKLLETKWINILEQILQEDKRDGDGLSDSIKSAPKIDYTKISIGAGKNLMTVIGDVMVNAISEALQLQRVKQDVIKKYGTVLKSELEAELPALLSKVKLNEDVALPDLSAVFDINRIKDVDANAFCEIKVKVDMENLKWGYYDKDGGGVTGAMLTN